MKLLMAAGVLTMALLSAPHLSDEQKSAAASFDAPPSAAVSLGAQCRIECPSAEQGVHAVRCVAPQSNSCAHAVAANPACRVDALPLNWCASGTITR